MKPQLCDVIISISFIDEPDPDTRYPSNLLYTLDLDVRNRKDIDDFLRHVVKHKRVMHADALQSAEMSFVKE